jgi:hypothetical protein
MLNVRRDTAAAEVVNEQAAPDEPALNHLAERPAHLVLSRVPLFGPFIHDSAPARAGATEGHP